MATLTHSYVNTKYSVSSPVVTQSPYRVTTEHSVPSRARRSCLVATAATARAPVAAVVASTFPAASPVVVRWCAAILAPTSARPRVRRVDASVRTGAYTACVGGRVASRVSRVWSRAPGDVDTTRAASCVTSSATGPGVPTAARNVSSVNTSALGCVESRAQTCVVYVTASR